MKSVLFIIGLLCPLSGWGQQTGVSIKYLGFGTQPIDNNLEYIQLTLSASPQKSCQVTVPLEVFELKSKRKDNPFIKAQCIRNGKNHIESKIHDTQAYYRLHSYGGSRSRFSVKLVLVNPETSVVEEFNFTNIIVEGRVNQKYIGLDKT